MILLKPDPTRRIEIPGVISPVRRPVDIDQAKTGFTKLRTLRIYRFDKDTALDGHAEEDEVFLVVLAGRVTLTIGECSTPIGPAVLQGPDGNTAVACAAYLPPGSAYFLVAETDAEVAYVRATPAGCRAARIFSSVGLGASVLLEETAHAERLRLRLVALQGEFTPAREAGSESLLHIRTDGEVMVYAGEAVGTVDLDTIAVTNEEEVTVKPAVGSSGFVLQVSAV